MKTTDQRGQEYVFDQTPQRIVSLVPSITELLCDLGLQDRIVGCTKFCVHPEGLRQEVSIVGGTKSVHRDRVINCQADIIIANKEENRQEDIEVLQDFAPIWISDISTLKESTNMIIALGELFQVREEAEHIIRGTKQIFSNLDSMSLSTAYLIWQEPYMTVGHDTYIHDIMDKLGWQNVFRDQTRYPEVSIDDLSDRSPDVVLLSSEPFPFAQRHLDHISGQLKDSLVILVDGEFFSWYGSRLMHLVGYANQLLEDIGKHLLK